MTINNQKERFFILDLVRGVAVFLMILAHSVFFLHNSTSPFLLGLEKIGNTLAFTTFLVVSGATTYIAYLSDESKPRKAGKRLRALLFAYFGLTFFISLPQILAASGFSKLILIFNLLTLRDLPSFTEFIPPFFIFLSFIILFRNFFKKIAESIPKAVIFSLVAYFLGMLFYLVPVADFTAPWKALLAGAEGYYRFPILQYFSVYILGLSWGYWLLKVRSVKHQKEIAQSISLAGALGFLAVASISFFVPSVKETLFLRWPPSIPFLLFGLSIAFGIAVLFYKGNLLRHFRILRDSVLILGQNALGLVVSHVLILSFYAALGGAKTDSLFLFFIFLLIVIILSLALATFLPFNLKFTLNIHCQDHCEETLARTPLANIGEEVYKEAEKEIRKAEKFFYIKFHPSNADPKLVKKRHVLAAALTFALASFIVIPPVAEEFIENKRPGASGWWNDSYAYRQKVEIKNNESLSSIPKGQLLQLDIDHATLVEAKKVNPDGSDFSLVFWNGKKYEEAKFWATEGLGSQKAKIVFETKREIDPSDLSKDYQLYYGNLLASKKTTQANPKPWSSKYSIALSPEEGYPDLLSTDRNWILKKEGNESLGLHIKSDRTDVKGINYEVIGTNLSGEMLNIDDTWEAVVKTAALKPGQYQVQAKIKTEKESFYTQKKGFFVSYPLYVAMTYDWEGYDVPENYLSAMTRMADKYGLTLTHMFNPRIYTTSTISQERAAYLTSWVKNRQATNGDDVQLHLHMFYDFLEKAGVTPKKQPNWGDKGDGYGSLTTNYTEAELTKILNFAIKLMTEQGFEKPIIYRAGGWFAGLDALKAMENVGIRADSSGRTAYNFFTQKGPWNLGATAQPYYPSKNNQNQNGNANFNILEIPNNGADSYWFSGSDLVKRFNENYKGEILTEKKQYTIVSHPHWLKKEEQDRLEGLFNLMGKYNYKNDNGPIIYATLSEVYEEFK